MKVSILIEIFNILWLLLYLYVKTLVIMQSTVMFKNSTDAKAGISLESFEVCDP